jgi:hypothetical protein
VLPDTQNWEAASRETSQVFDFPVLISRDRALDGQFGKLKAMYSPE